MGVEVSGNGGSKDGFEWWVGKRGGGGAACLDQTLPIQVFQDFQPVSETHLHLHALQQAAEKGKKKATCFLENTRRAVRGSFCI